ncbi:polysaccharide deacetylase family protein [Alteromonas sp. ASW11-19]|uniref:Polysaccharide deacetylase family protein n=1 Tax=Alteromonas salexigens TaxID=2982530 RepID=A0ABT2VKI7_9ALTE|nr:polysaccharide deacetylase family protein [Alteromonas salexigens]MCU7553539.1 polysaccharide deacetylase family protein [Alteromonas salexigens]
MKYNMGLRRRFVAFTSLVMALAATTVACADTNQKLNNAVVLLYHHVATDTPASTSVSPDTFKAHMAYLDSHHTVLPLATVIERIQNGETLPDKTVVITFDDGYENILTNAHPILQEYDFPYTIFINPGEIGSNASQLSWQQVKAMHSDGVSFANHTMDHLHMLERNAGESQTDWLARLRDNVEQAEQAIEAQTGTSLKYLAYPFGEYNDALADMLQAQGYIAFGQHSGGISSHSDMQTLPRFPAAGPYAKLSSLKTKLASLAMPVSDSNLTDPEISGGELAEPLQFSVNSTDVSMSQLACFFQGETLNPTVENTTVTVTVGDLPVGRSRVNCTAPSKASAGRYYWYSQPFFVADSQGRYPD